MKVDLYLDTKMQDDVVTQKFSEIDLDVAINKLVELIKRTDKTTDLRLFDNTIWFTGIIGYKTYSASIVFDKKIDSTELDEVLLKIKDKINE